MQKIIIILQIVLTIPIGFAAEIDSVTPRKISLDNSIEAINEIFNQRFKEGIRKANAPQEPDEDPEEFFYQPEDTYCSEEALYTELRKAVFQSLTASWGLKGYSLDLQLRELLSRTSYSLSLKDSVYRDINYIEGFSLNLKELSDVININNNLVGLDKIGHFFAEGWQYFDITENDGESLQQAIAWGREKEEGLFGYTTTGIFSFADLVANLNGWRFWNKVLLKQDDPLKGMIANLFSRSYVSCDIQIIDSIKNRKIVKAWEYNSKIDLADFIDGAWDEGNNCNSYADPTIEEKVTKRINQVDPNFSCPLNSEMCVEAREYYGPYSKYILHPLCLTAN